MAEMDVIPTTVLQLSGALEASTAETLLTLRQLEIFQIVNFVFICSIICVLGVGANIVNIIVYFKQGFANSVNISFFGLAISDLCCLLTLLWLCFCANPFIINSGVPWVYTDLMYITAAWPHMAFGRITSYITVFVSAERCLCITVPLKVKEMITPRRTTLTVSFIYILNIFPLVPEFVTSYLDFKFFPETNKTLLVIYFTSNRESVAGLVYLLSAFTGMLSFLGVIVVTVILIVKLTQISKWRKEATSGSVHAGLVSTREKKTVKMVAIIALILIVCYSPGSAVGLATFVEVELSLRGRYVDMAISMWSIAFIFQAINSSINILLYYKMSTKYRETLHELAGSCGNRGRAHKKVVLKSSVN